MNKALLFFYCLFISASAFATHNIGGAIYYKYLGNNQYEITAYNYQDVTQVSQYLTLDVSGASVSFLTLTYAGSTEINIACNIPLYTYKFVGILSLPPQQSSDVVLSYGTCCRLPNMTNLNSTPGMLIKTVIHPNVAQLVNNSAPQQYISKRFSYTQDSIVTINAFVEDDNISDSVFIDFTAPLDNNVTLPMSYAQNYSATQPFGTATPTFINNRTGVITVLNPQQGMYTVALKITSFINGTAIGETHWDFIVHISSTIDPVISWNEINFTGTQATYHNNNATYITAEFDTLEIAVNGQAGLTDSLTLRAFGQKLQGSLNNVSGICTTGNCAQFTGTTLNALQSANGTFYYTTGFGLVPANRDTARVAFVFEVVAKNACGIEVSNAFSVNIIIPKTGSIWSQHVYSTCNFNGVQAHISGDTSNLSWSPTVGVSNATSASPWLNRTISTTYTVTNLNNGDIHEITVEVDLISPPIIAENNGIVSLLNAKNYAAIVWYHNGVVIGNDISHVLATLPGTYYVQVFEGDCSLYSDTIYVSGFGIQEEIIGANIYPQPMADILTVEIMGTAQFEMLDAAGRMLISSTITDKTEINTAALPAGMYIYKLQQNGALKTGKLLK